MNQIGLVNNYSILKTILLSISLLFYFAVGDVHSAPGSNKEFEFVAYNFGSLGKLSPKDQITLLKKAGYKGIILNSESKADSIGSSIVGTVSDGVVGID